MLQSSVAVRLDEPLGRIDPNLYGHFAEHLGRCIDEGIWVGEGSEQPNHCGMRSDVIKALRAIGAPVIRWPGGCYADAHDWRDGVGPREKRPRRINVWWNKEEDNQFGTDELVRFCRLVGAEPYICGNVGSGTPREMMQWLEYCNYEGSTTLAQERQANGSPEPFRVKYWGIGNENYGCGGEYGAGAYAHEYRRFASYLRRIDPRVQLIACGHTPEWNLEFLNSVGNVGYVDHLSVHHYYNCGPGVGFSEEQWYGMFPRAAELEGRVRNLSQLLSHFERGKRVGAIVDEWGVWHPEADVGLYQPNTLRDALSAAVVFDVLNRQAEFVTMANIAQTINVLQCLIQTDGAAMWLTPTYHAYDLYKGHMGNVSVRVDADAPRHEFALDGRHQSTPLLSCSGSRNEATGEVVLSLTNLHLSRGMEVRVRVPGAEISGGTLRVLTAINADDVNSFAEPERVVPVEEAVAGGAEATVRLPARSVATARLRVE